MSFDVFSCSPNEAACVLRNAGITFVRRQPNRIWPVCLATRTAYVGAMIGVDFKTQTSTPKGSVSVLVTLAKLMGWRSSSNGKPREGTVFWFTDRLHRLGATP